MTPAGADQVGAPDRGRPSTLLNVLDFGAVGDGVRDDTAALQAAIDAAGAVRGTVVVPPGCYLTGELQLRRAVTLRGDAPFSYREACGSVLKLKSGAAAGRCLLNLTGAIGCHVISLCLAGGGAELGAAETPPVHGILIDKPDYGREEDTVCIDSCRIERFSGDGIRLERIWCFSVRHSHCFGNGGAGLRVRGWDGFVLDNWFSGNHDAGYAATAENASVTMTGNRIEWNRAGGILIRNGSHYNLTGNYLDRSGNTGLALENCRVVTATGNVIYRSGKAQWQGPDPETNAQVRLINCEGVVLSANSLNAGRDDGGAGDFSPLYGLVLKDCRSCVVKDNVLAGGALKLLVLDHGGHRDCVVRDNPGTLHPGV